MQNNVHTKYGTLKTIWIERNAKQSKAKHRSLEKKSHKSDWELKIVFRNWLLSTFNAILWENK